MRPVSADQVFAPKLAGADKDIQGRGFLGPLDLKPGDIQVLPGDPGQGFEHHAFRLPRQLQGPRQANPVSQVYFQFIRQRAGLRQAQQIMFMGNPGDLVEPEQPLAQPQQLVLLRRALLGEARQLHLHLHLTEREGHTVGTAAR